MNYIYIIKYPLNAICWKKQFSENIDTYYHYKNACDEKSRASLPIFNYLNYPSITEMHFGHTVKSTDINVPRTTYLS